MNQITIGRRAASLFTFALAFAVLAAACGEGESTSAEAASTTATIEVSTTAVSTTAVSTTAVSTTAVSTTAVPVAEDGALEQRRLDRSEAVGAYTTFYGIEPTADEQACLQNDEAMAIELDEVDEENLPLVLISMCMPDEMTGITDTLVAGSGLDEADQKDLTCYFEQAALITSEMNLQQRLVSAATEEPTPEELEQINSACNWEPGRFAEVAVLLQ